MPLYLICLLEYISLYLAPLPLLIYLREDVTALNRPIMYVIYRILFILQSAATTCFLAIHALNLVHFTETLKYMQILILCHLIYFVIVEFMNLQISQKLVHRLFLLGMLLLSSCVVFIFFSL